MNQEQLLPSLPFTSYQKFVIFLLTITQFTVVLDFMVMSPLGDMMMKTLKITPSQFSTAVSAYAFSAGSSGLLTAGFADRFDRKKLLLFFYIGFAIGTLFCALAPNYELLVLARVITGIFGGVIGSISMAIVADLFIYQQRGKVMSFVQMGFGASQVLGIPIGLFIANRWGWHMPFLWIAILAGIIAFLLFLNLKPITAHLGLKRENDPFKHLWHIVFQKNHQIAFLSTATLSVGGFMMMPFGSAFAVNNLKVSEVQLPMLFMAAGIGVFVIMPFIGQLSDRMNKFKIFAVATLLAIVLINIYSRFSATPFYIVLITNILMMMALMSRSIPISTLTSAIPAPQDRGAFMSINISLQQMAGGLGAMLAGVIIVQKDNFSPLQNYDLLAIIASCIMLFSIYLVYIVNNIVAKKQ